MQVKVDKLTFKGTARQIIRQMWATSFDEAETKKEYMNNLQSRLEEFHNVNLNRTGYTAFLNGLIELGLVELVDYDDENPIKFPPPKDIEWE